jgi:hypothetical protein
MTRKLYWEDPHLTRCEARVIERVQDGGQVRIVLDATVFYPESGGQPADRGTINGMPVGTVIMEGGRIVHIVDVTCGRTRWCVLSTPRVAGTTSAAHGAANLSRQYCACSGRDRVLHIGRRYLPPKSL